MEKYFIISALLNITVILFLASNNKPDKKKIHDNKRLESTGNFYFNVFSVWVIPSDPQGSLPGSSLKNYSW